jgi:periplasmic divalent cation tolerance protein
VLLRRGKVEEDEELLLLCKTRSACVAAVVSRVKAEGFAELPETIALPIVGGSATYLTWIRETVREQPNAEQ